MRIFFLILLLSATLSHAQFSPAEIKLRAVFILNFLNLTSFPDKEVRSVRLCFFRPSELSKKTKEVNELSNGSKKVTVQVLNDTSGQTSCDAYYLETEKDKNKVAREYAALTISGEPNLGIIRMYSENNKIRFDIKRTKGEQVGLSFSSKLLQVANKVH